MVKERKIHTLEELALEKEWIEELERRYLAYLNAKELALEEEKAQGIVPLSALAPRRETMTRLLEEFGLTLFWGQPKENKDEST